MFTFNPEMAADGDQLEDGDSAFDTREYQNSESDDDNVNVRLCIYLICPTFLCLSSMQCYSIHGVRNSVFICVRAQTNVICLQYREVDFGDIDIEYQQDTSEMTATKKLDALSLSNGGASSSKPLEDGIPIEEDLFDDSDLPDSDED